MIKKEMIAMLLAGGRGKRLGVLTSRMAKPAVPFGGKYRIIDFPLSNCINSGVDTVGVLTQYMPLKLNKHIGIGIPWDLDRLNGGVSVLPPYERIQGTEWYTGTANAVWQNMTFMESYHPEYVLILPGDHIYKMDYGSMLDFHKANGADVSIAVRPAAEDEAIHFGRVIADDHHRITACEEKTEHSGRALAPMGICIFSWDVLYEALDANRDVPGLDFGRHIIPYCLARGANLCAFEFNGYWRDVGTLSSYWEANMGLIDIVPEFNLYEEYWKIYTKGESRPPVYYGRNSDIERSIIGDGSEIYGRVYRSVIGSDVIIGEGAEIHDSIIMNGARIDEDTWLSRVIAAENAHVGARVRIGEGPMVPNESDPSVYTDGLSVIAQEARVPAGVILGRNVVVNGITDFGDYPEGILESGRTLNKEAGTP